jgi:hypothetical protein
MLAVFPSISPSIPSESAFGRLCDLEISKQKIQFETKSLKFLFIVMRNGYVFVNSYLEIKKYELKWQCLFEI